MQRVQTQRVGGSDLLFLLGEELKAPLINIMHLSELGEKDILIKAQAQKALNTIDNVLLYKRLQSGQLELHPEPVHVGSTIVKVAEAVEPQMRMSGCWTELDIQHSLQTADIDKQLLSSALLGMWQAFISTLQTPTAVVCSAQRITNGIRVSITSSGAQMENFSLTGTNNVSTQPVLGVAGPATDLLTANNMFELVGRKLTKSRRKHMSGIGVTLPISRQIQLV